jgi:hypothetical protein
MGTFLIIFGLKNPSIFEKSLTEKNKELQGKERKKAMKKLVVLFSFVFILSFIVIGYSAPNWLSVGKYIQQNGEKLNIKGGNLTFTDTIIVSEDPNMPGYLVIDFEWGMKTTVEVVGQQITGTIKNTHFTIKPGRNSNEFIYTAGDGFIRFLKEEKKVITDAKKSEGTYWKTFGKFYDSEGYWVIIQASIDNPAVIKITSDNGKSFFSSSADENQFKFIADGDNYFILKGKSDKHIIYYNENANTKYDYYKKDE